MKVVHSFSSLEIIWKELAYVQMLSSLYAIKHYGNIHFYGSKEAVNQVLNMGIPYDTTNSTVISDKDSETFSIPKIKVFKSINEPFLHLDTDTIIYDKIDFSSIDSPFLFSHPDISTDHFEDGLRKSMNNLITHLRSFERPEKRYFYDFNNTYLGLFFKLQHLLSDSTIKAFDVGSIPNMNIVFVKEYKTFKKACEETLTHYYSAKQDIDSQTFGACYIEQLILHLNLRAQDSKYKYLSDNNKHTLFNQMPFLPGAEHNLTPKVDSLKYPFTFTIPDIKCECCNMIGDRKHSIGSREQFKDYLNFEFHGFFHATFMKWHEHFQAIIINKIIEEFGQEYVLSVHRFFKQEYPNHKLPVVSGGEKFYEELTGNKLFSE